MNVNHIGIAGVLFMIVGAILFSYLSVKKGNLVLCLLRNKEFSRVEKNIAGYGFVAVVVGIIMWFSSILLIR